MSAAPQVKDTLKFDIEIVAGPHTGLKANFSKASVSIGRGPENDIVLSGDPRASRQHAEIKQRSNGEFVIVNLSPKNFVMLNGQNIQSEILTNDSIILIGDSEIRFKVEVPTPTVPPPSAAPVFSAPTPFKPQASVPQAPAYQAPRPMQTPAMPQGGVPGMPNPSFPPAQPVGGYGGYQPPPPGPMPSAARGSSGGGLLENPKARFYGIIAILALVGWFLMSPSKNKDNKDPNAIRTSSITMQDVAAAEKRSQELLIVKKEKYDSVQYRRSQENFIKGFRDFQQGQYARAREAFQVVLNLDPDNELAKRYYHLSKIKFDELVKFNMIQGNRYREKKNWRMCQSNYSNVMTMLSNRRDDPSYKEAKQFYEECTLNMEGRF
ncbi:FHA domain-containing protein [Bdellovibrio reynosensis]|uniref:FHA domain-containing protein n=1 Tax=Bdellovibrio reynosensis TaxID=2835041 RepID=A0ABY4C671_9BACT|nr:FHA domain-containing protein [Bdellovibrio reynosensis]UOE99983.1 FHA domain-containing protein [Bdellovibrio reynosensis]